MTNNKLDARLNRNFMDDEFGRSGQSEKNFESSLVFLIMSFSDEKSKEIHNIYRSECRRQGLNLRRGDDIPDSGIILKYIIEMIEKAEFIICDLTDERPNVYYELGYAHGVGNRGKNILLTASTRTELHFDIAPLRVHFYEDDEQLRSIMRTQFKSLVRNARKENGNTSFEPFVR